MSLRDLVTILLPVRDEEERAVEALAALRAVADGARILVVDDGSADRTPALLRSCAGDATVLTVPRRGLPAALNAGLAAVETPFVARHDADDRSHPGRFRRQAQALLGRPDAVLCATGFEEVGRDGRSRIVEPPGDWGALYRALLRTNPIAHGSVMAPAAVLRAAGGYDEGLRHGQDYDLWLRLSALGPFLVLPDVLYTRTAPAGAELRRKRRRQAAASARAQLRHLRTTGRLRPLWLARNVASAAWPGPRLLRTGGDRP